MIGSTEDVCYSQERVSRPSAAASSLRAQALGHADALFRLAYHLTGSEADAEDLVQDTFARAFSSAERLSDDTNLRAWLFRILRNAHIDGYRRARKNPVRSGLEADFEPEQTGELLRDDAELERLRGIVAQDIEAALQTLSHDARTIILLELEGLTESELASVLGCALGTVKSRLTRARAALRERLRDYAR